MTNCLDRRRPAVAEHLGVLKLGRSRLGIAIGEATGGGTPGPGLAAVSPLNQNIREYWK